MHRRDFIKLAAMSPLIKFAPQLFFNPLYAAEVEPILVVVFLRGAMDGLSLLPPIEDPQYFKARPNIAIKPKEGAPIKLKDGFALHPAFHDIRQIFERGEGTFIFGAGSPAQTRSHFDAQDWMEAGAIHSPNYETGFIGRLSNQFQSKQDQSPPLISVQSGQPRIIRGSNSGLAISDLKSLKLGGPLTKQTIEGTNNNEEAIDPAILNLYAKSADPLFKNAARSFLQGSSVFQKAQQIFDAEKANLPKGPLAKDLGQIGALIKADIGLRLAVTEMGGWDTHVYQGDAEKGSLRDRFSELDAALGYFWKSLPNKHDQVCLVVMTEFGRTVAENGDKGTDHGHGSTFMVLNGRLQSQKIHHQFAGLDKNKLFEQRDLPVNFDYRDIFSNIVADHLKLNTKGLFEEFSSENLKNKIKLFKA